MLASRLITLLPPLSQEDAVASAAILSLTGHFDSTQWKRRMFRAPHHSASSVALVGGGVPPRPGEISLAHCGVLFLDELPEFNRSTLEALREPLENGRITISRASRRAEYPARFQLVAAMNPCPCGYLGHPMRACRCSPEQVARYQGRISGPLLDRLDVWVEVPFMSPTELTQSPPGERSASIAERVARAHARQHARQGALNAHLPAQQLESVCQLQAAAQTLLLQAGNAMGWSARSLHRVLRLARTLADLSDAHGVDVNHVAEAIQYRRALLTKGI